MVDFTFLLTQVPEPYQPCGFANRISSWVEIPFTGISNLISPKVSVSAITLQQSGAKFKGWIALLPVLLTE
jgi:hypothetical protein